MISSSRSRVAAIVLAGALASFASVAQEGGPEMNAEQAAMMAAWQQAMAPGEPHAHLAKAEGRWDMTIKAWIGEPGVEPVISEGSCENTMILGGRVLQQKATSQMMGMPFEGIGMSGYDNTTGRYWSSWLDNMSTGTYTAYGTLDEAGVMTLHGEMMDPMGGGTIQVRSVLRDEGDDRSVFEWYETRDGQEAKTMEITYTRREE